MVNRTLSPNGGELGSLQLSDLDLGRRLHVQRRRGEEGHVGRVLLLDQKLDLCAAEHDALRALLGNEGSRQPNEEGARLVGQDVEGELLTE